MSVDWCDIPRSSVSIVSTVDGPAILIRWSNDESAWRGSPTVRWALNERNTRQGRAEIVATRLNEQQCVAVASARSDAHALWLADLFKTANENSGQWVKWEELPHNSIGVVVTQTGAGSGVVGDIVARRTDYAYFAVRSHDNGGCAGPWAIHASNSYRGDVYVLRRGISEADHLDPERHGKLTDAMAAVDRLRNASKSSVDSAPEIKPGAKIPWSQVPPGCYWASSVTEREYVRWVTTDSDGDDCQELTPDEIQYSRYFAHSGARGNEVPVDEMGTVVARLDDAKCHAIGLAKWQADRWRIATGRYTHASTLPVGCVWYGIGGWGGVLSDGTIILWSDDGKSKPTWEKPRSALSIDSQNNYEAQSYGAVELDGLSDSEIRAILASSDRRVAVVNKAREKFGGWTLAGRAWLESRFVDIVTGEIAPWCADYKTAVEYIKLTAQAFNINSARRLGIHVVATNGKFYFMWRGDWQVLGNFSDMLAAYISDPPEHGEVLMSILGTTEIATFDDGTVIRRGYDEDFNDWSYAEMLGRVLVKNIVCSLSTLPARKLDDNVYLVSVARDGLFNGGPTPVSLSGSPRDVLVAWVDHSSVEKETSGLGHALARASLHRHLREHTKLDLCVEAKPGT